MDIHHIFSLTRPLFVFDTETTDLNPANARIVEIGFQKFTSQGLELEWRSLINPGIRIPEKNSDVHGITNTKIASCRECGYLPVEHPSPNCSEFKPNYTFKQVAPRLAHNFSNCDFAGKNIRYDLRVTAAEMERNGQPWSYAGARIIDADRLEHLGEPRTLSHLYEKHLGKKMEDAHEALADVRGTTEVIVAQMQKYHTLPRALDMLHDLQWPGWIDSEGKFKFVDGVPCVGQWGKWSGTPMHKVEKSYWDWILKNNFAPDIKALASGAKLNKYPVFEAGKNNGEGQDISD